MTERSAAAQAILAIPLFSTIMDELEATEINIAVNAKYDDHEIRQGNMAAVRAIRNLRSRLNAIANEGQNAAKKAPA